MFYNLGAGGDGTNNYNWGLFPQNALVIGEDNTVLVSGSTPLRPAEHKSPATYNIWRNINFGHEAFPTNLGVREAIRQMTARGLTFQTGDVIGMATLPSLAILKGVMFQVNAAQAGTVFDVVLASTGDKIITGIDASATGVYYVDIAGGFVVPPDTNDSIAIEITSWPALDAGADDPCGVYGPCDDMTLCVTVNAFIWAPVSADFCSSDPCFGAQVYAPYQPGDNVSERLSVAVTSFPEPEPEPVEPPAG